MEFGERTRDSSPGHTGSHDQYIVRERESRDVYTDELIDSDDWLDREYWDSERGEYRTRGADEAEYKGWPFYTKKYDSYFPSFA